MANVPSIPPFLLAELHLAFRSCRSTRSSTAFRPIIYRQQTCNVHRETQQHHASAPNANPSDKHVSTEVTKKNDSKAVASNVSTTELVPQKDGRRSLGAARPVEVPLKVVPKAELLSPKLRLTPQERLHIEALTRRTPRTIEKTIYKEKLLIYHQGTGRETALIFSKFLTIFGLAVNSTIIVPALYTASTPIWICTLTLAAGFLPIWAVHALTSPMVNRIYLHLPSQARQSPQSAMEYARNLPQTAMLDIEYLRPIPLTRSTRALLADLERATTRWRPATFKWKNTQRADSGSLSWLWPAPLEFFVRPESSRGKAARYTVPGIWPSVYKRLTGEETRSVSRWKR